MIEIVAIVAFRNEEAFLGNCLLHLIRNGVRIAAIDNASTDASSSILRLPEIEPHVIAYETVPYEGYFPWESILARKMALAKSIAADWILHVDADEIMHSYHDETLSAAIQRIAETGCTAINFDEFVFLPIEHEYQSNCRSMQPLLQYYFFEPTPNRLMRAWKAETELSMTESGGHILSGDALVLATESLALRHYPFRNQAHAFEKYATRQFNPAELARGWHLNRSGKSPEDFRFPPSNDLHRLERADSRKLERKEPKTKHYWEWSRPE